jgi:hypothetical protein
VTVVTKGVVDVNVSNELDTNHIVLVVNCGDGLPNDLDHIPSGSAITLMLDDTTNDVTVIHEKTTECPFSYMEVDADTADKLKLRDGDRYALQSDRHNNLIIKMKLLTRSDAYALVKKQHNASGDDPVVIGYMLLCRLGIPDNDNSVITLRSGTISKQLNVTIPDNALDTDIRFKRADLRKFNLHPGKKVLLRYDRATKTLDINPGKPVTAAKKSSRRDKTARRTGTNPHNVRFADRLHKRRAPRSNSLLDHAATADRLPKQQAPRTSYPLDHAASTDKAHKPRALRMMSCA